MLQVASFVKEGFLDARANWQSADGFGRLLIALFISMMILMELMLMVGLAYTPNIVNWINNIQICRV